MQGYEKKYSPFFFDPLDEIEFEATIKKLSGDICFIDGSRWASVNPPICGRLSECRNGIVFIWSPVACPTLPYQVRDDGMIQGPTSGIVIQYIRSVLKDDQLLSGDMGIGFEKNNFPISRFVQNVWKAAKSMNSGKLKVIDPFTKQALRYGIKEYFLGPSAKEKSFDGMLLRHCASPVFYAAE